MAAMLATPRLGMPKPNMPGTCRVGWGAGGRGTHRERPLKAPVCGSTQRDQERERHVMGVARNDWRIRQ